MKMNWQNSGIWLMAVVALTVPMLAFTPAAEAGGPHYHHGRFPPGPPAWHRSYYSIGYRVHSLPRTYISVSVGGSRFFYSSGVFYRPWQSEFVVVRAPIGAVVPVLPPVYRRVYWGPRYYYYANDVYYTWVPERRGYMVVADPGAGTTPGVVNASVDTSVFAYPRHGQDEEQAQRDRYECYLWAVRETGYDPSRSDSASGGGASDYVRANTACLEGRGYTVK